jgi:hypothetical protein
MNPFVPAKNTNLTISPVSLKLQYYSNAVCRNVCQHKNLHFSIINELQFGSQRIMGSGRETGRLLN